MTVVQRLRTQQGARQVTYSCHINMANCWLQTELGVEVTGTMNELKAN